MRTAADGAPVAEPAAVPLAALSGPARGQPPVEWNRQLAAKLRRVLNQRIDHLLALPDEMQPQPEP